MKTHYPFLISEKVLYLDFEFASKGPNGTIRKVVRYELRNAGGSTYFDLGFGDWNDKTKEINHVVITNNRDTNKILATVALTALEFTRKFPDLFVYAIGSTPARTRLYQIMISRNLETIEALFNIYGLCNEAWQRFQRNTKYEAFAVRRKT